MTLKPSAPAPNPNPVYPPEDWHVRWDSQDRPMFRCNHCHRHTSVLEPGIAYQQAPKNSSLRLLCPSCATKAAPLQPIRPSCDTCKRTRMCDPYDIQTGKMIGINQYDISLVCVPCQDRGQADRRYVAANPSP